MMAIVEAYEHVRRRLEGMGLRTWYRAAAVPGGRGDGVLVGAAGTENERGGMFWILERDSLWYVMCGSPLRRRICEVARADVVEFCGVFHEVFKSAGVPTREKWVSVVDGFGLKTVGWAQWAEDEEARWQTEQRRRGWKALGDEEEQRFYRWFNSTNWLTGFAEGTPVMAVDLSAVAGMVQKWPGGVYDEIELRLEGELREVLRGAVGREGELIAVDVNHSAWRFRPWVVRVDWGQAWPVAVMPGEWSVFVEGDYSGGVFGDPGTGRLCAFGERFVWAMRGRDWGRICAGSLRNVDT